MDLGQALIINLAKGKIGADNANVIGGLVLTNIMNAAFSRHDIPERERQPFFIYADEFHAFTTASVADMLSEARKYAVGIFASHQHTSQTEQAVMDSILGNAGTIIALRIGAKDAPLIAKQVGDIEAHYYTSLPNHRGFIQLMDEGRKRPVFSFSTLPPTTNL